MGWIRAAVGARQRLWLLLGVVAVALSLLTMHQLSSNHTVADAAAPADGTMHLSVAMAHVDSHEIDSGRIRPCAPDRRGRGRAPLLRGRWVPRLR